MDLEILIDSLLVFLCGRGSVGTGEDLNSPGYVDSKSDDAYFRDVMFGSLLRTTSVLESANSFYGNFVDKHAETQVGQVELRIINNAPRFEHLVEYGETRFKGEQIIDTCTSCCMVNMSDVNGIKTYNVRDDYGECVAIDEWETIMNQLISDFYSCVGLLDDKPDMMKAFSLHMNQKKEALLSECVDSATRSISIQQNLEKYCGVEVPFEVHILPPEQAKNKGRGSHIPNGREVFMVARRLGQRRCSRLYSEGKDVNPSHVSLVDPMNVSICFIAYRGEPILSPVSTHGNWTITGLDNAARRDFALSVQIVLPKCLINNHSSLESSIEPSLEPSEEPSLEPFVQLPSKFSLELAASLPDPLSPLSPSLTEISMCIASELTVDLEATSKNSNSHFNSIDSYHRHGSRCLEFLPVIYWIDLLGVQ
ncbi:hypothetical protein V2J09_010663 [Rumex salicifolius]